MMVPLPLHSSVVTSTAIFHVVVSQQRPELRLAETPDLTCRFGAIPGTLPWKRRPGKQLCCSGGTDGCNVWGRRRSEARV